MLRRFLAAVAPLVVLGLAATAVADAPVHRAAVRLSLVGRFVSPVYMTAPASDRDRLFVAEQPGRIRVVRKGKVLATPFLDIRSKVACCGERGLESIAFAPDYGTSRQFYVFYTARPSGDLRVAGYKADPANPDRALASSARTVLTIGHSRFPNHNGGQLQFGPDGRLYVSTGDGGGGGDPQNHAQSRRSLLGKILRIEPARRGARPVVYSYGLRNPFRFSFDRGTGDMTIGDVGQGRYEEIDFARKGTARGANFGWNVFEGNSRFRSGSAPGARRPAIVHSHSAGWCAIIGGYVVRDTGLKGVYGRYVYGDNCKGDVYYAKLGTGRASSVGPLGLHVPSISSFGEDAAGHIYVASTGGNVFRIRAR
jgi:glucose/arabinose dehydrogenase